MGDDQKMTPLHIAAINNFPEITEFLLREKNANVHAQDERGWTPLHIAAEHNSLDVIQTLLRHEANIDCRAKNTDTPLHIAICSNQPIAVDAILQCGALVNARGEKNFTPLHKAAKMGNTEICEKLIKAGARIDHRAENKNTPLHTAAANGQAAVVQILTNEAVTGQCVTIMDINKSGFNGWNAFHQASIGGHVDTMEELLKAGCKLNQEDDYSFDTALHLAARFGQDESIGFLVDQDNIRIDAMNKENKTALDLCKLKGHDLAERYLLESEAKTGNEVKKIQDKNTIGFR